MGCKMVRPIEHTPNNINIDVPTGYDYATSAGSSLWIKACRSSLNVYTSQQFTRLQMFSDTGKWWHVDPAQSDPNAPIIWIEYPPRVKVDGVYVLKTSSSTSSTDSSASRRRSADGDGDGDDEYTYPEHFFDENSPLHDCGEATGGSGDYCFSNCYVAHSLFLSNTTLTCDVLGVMSRPRLEHHAVDVFGDLGEGGLPDDIFRQEIVKGEKCCGGLTIHHTQWPAEVYADQIAEPVSCPVTDSTGNANALSISALMLLATAGGVIGLAL